MAAVGFGMWAWALACGGGAAAPPTPPASPASPVHVQRVERSAATSSLALPGVLAAERSVVLRPETSGLVTSVGFEHGQRVTKGQVLVRLADAEPRAAVAEAEARVALAKAQLDRTRTLVERQNASQAELERASAEADLAAASRDRAREALRRTVVRAPFAGVVGLREVVEGDLVDPSRPVTTLVGEGALAVDVQVPERDLQAVVVGGRATVEVDAAPGASFPGSVVYVAPEIREGSRTFAVRVALDAADPLLRPGLTARVLLEGATREGLRVPAQAVLTTARGPAVYLVGAEGKAELRPVVTADRDETSVRVVEGLAEGDQVIVDGLVRLRPGSALRVLE